MDRTFARRLLISSLVGAGAVATASACSSPEPQLPPDPNPVHVAAKPPPAISGGTLYVTKSGIAVASDSDRDFVWLANLETKELNQVALNEDDEPGRIAEDGAGRVHVVLRRAGEVVTIDPATAKIVDRTAVCGAPRGIVYEAAKDSLHVACAGGELVTLAAKGGKPTRTLHFMPDLRDVVLNGDKLVVSRFREAKFLVVDADGVLLNEQNPITIPRAGGNGDPKMEPEFGNVFGPSVAWRSILLPNGKVGVVHQRALLSPVVIEENGYDQGGGCDGSIVTGTVSEVDPTGDPDSPDLPTSPALIGASLPVDLAVDATGAKMLVAAAGSNVVFQLSSDQLHNESVPANSGFMNCSSQMGTPIEGEPIAVAFWNGRPIAQTRQPAGIVFVDDTSDKIALPGEDMADTGHFLFHHAANETASLACASCHPEGQEDGNTWVFDPIGPRRTQTISGDVLATAPLHWDGDMSGLDAIMSEVFVRRMGGLHQGPRHVLAFSKWMTTLPSLPVSPRGTQSQIDHGKELFEGKADCASCHSGTHFTSNQNKDVGTGRSFQVPMLKGISHRAPYMHDGCAPTLHDRFVGPASCTGGDKHGNVSILSTQEIDDLVAYLETL